MSTKGMPPSGHFSLRLELRDDDNGETDMVFHVLLPGNVAELMMRDAVYSPTGEAAKKTVAIREFERIVHHCAEDLWKVADLHSRIADGQIPHEHWQQFLQLENYGVEHGLSPDIVREVAHAWFHRGKAADQKED